MTAFEVLAEPHRRQILDLLRDRERPVGELVQALAVSQPAVSKHLRVLRDVGLVEARIAAQQRVYLVRAHPLQEIDEWLAPYRALWSSSLDALESHLDGMDPAHQKTAKRTRRSNR
ncbi:MAG TPA: metalloregulator ArsR/SmtB family transcription factor [Acidimicrobiales bacterium]